MSNLGSKTSRMSFLHFGSFKKTVTKLECFNNYYQTHSLRDTCKALKMKKTTALYYLSRIKKDLSNTATKGNSYKLFTPEQKQEVVSFYKHNGIDRTISMYRLSKGLILRWHYLCKNGFAGWEPDYKLIKRLRENKYLNHRRVAPTFLLSKQTIKNFLSMDEKIYGEINIWTNTLIRYRAINELLKITDVSIETLCAVAKVSIRGYYHWIQRKEPKRNRWNNELANKIKWIRKNNPDCYGARRLALAFYKKYKTKIGRRTILRYIDAMNLDTRQYDYSINSRYRAAPEVKNHLLDEKRKPNFKSLKKNKILVCDLSQLTLTEKKGKSLQLFALMDLHSRYILDFDFSNFESTNEMVIKTITRAFKNFHPKIIHSDGGREFSSWDYYHTCEQHNVIVSHSKPGRPTHNACIESFFKTLKHETHLRKLVKSKTPEQIKTIVRKWIDFYNNKRVHSSLSLNGQWVTPRAFRNGKKNKIIRTK